MTIGERIKFLRNQMGLTQEELAKFLSCPRATLGNWEIGRTEPDSEMLGKIAGFFSVSLDFLITGRESLNKPPDITDGLTAEEKTQVKQFVEFLKSRRGTVDEQAASASGQ